MHVGNTECAVTVSSVSLSHSVDVLSLPSCLLVLVILSYSYSLALEAGLAQWCHQCPPVSPTMVFRPTTDCQDSLFFCPAATADSCPSWICSQSLGSHRSAGEGHTVGVGLITLWGEVRLLHLNAKEKNHLVWRVLPQFYTVHAVSLGEFRSCTYWKAINRKE